MSQPAGATENGLELDASGEALVHVSAILRGLVEGGMPERITLGWLMAHLRERSFGASMLVLGVIGMAPIVSVAVGLLLVPLAAQIMAGHRNVVLPAMIANRPFDSGRVRHALDGMAAFLGYVETFLNPRGHHIFRMKRLIGAVVLLLALSLFIPIPMSNMLPAFVIAMIALGYLERDGLLLGLSLIVGAVSIAIASVGIYGVALAALAYIPG
jgi:hypothetical protein